MKLKTVEINVDELIPYANNAKEHPEWQIEQIVQSVEQFGFNDPIGAWHNENGDPVIVEGHGRLIAAKRLGIEKVPVVFLDHMDDEARRAYTLVHNQTTMNTGFDEMVLSAELADLPEFEMSDYGLYSIDDTGIKWGEDVPDLPDDYEADFEEDKRRCPKCGHVDDAKMFKKVKE